MNALGLVEVYSFTTAVCVADLAAKTANVRIIAFDRNRPLDPKAPAPLIMVVKMEGDVAAVKSAVEKSVAFAKAEGKYVTSHIIPRPGTDVEKMAYLLDINRDKYNKKLPKSFFGIEPEIGEASDIGLLEISGLVASIEALDAMLKAADVRLIHTEKRLGGRLVTLIVKGTVSNVKAAVEAGELKGEPLGHVYGKAVISRPHDELLKFFNTETD